MTEPHSGTAINRSATDLALKQRRKLTRYIIAYSFLVPIFVSMGLFKYYPFFTAIIKSLYQWNGANLNTFVGLDNFVKLVSDPTFYASLKNVTLLTISFVIIQLTLPLYAAVGVFHSHKKLQHAYRFLFLVPMVVPYIIIFCCGDGSI